MKHEVELIPGRNNLMVVAHPDDETIFGFAQLALSPSVWTVICVTNGDHPIRQREFVEASRVLGFKSEIWRFRDARWTTFSPHDQEEIALRVRDFCTRERIDNILTHGHAGEYGHLQHQTLHRVVRDTATASRYPGIYTFAQREIPLSGEILDWKLKTLQLYSSQNILPQHKQFVEREGWAYLPAPLHARN